MGRLIEDKYNEWKAETDYRFNKLKENEEELNRIFIDIYGLQDELTPNVSDKDITVTKVFDTKEEVYEDIVGNAYIRYKEDIVKDLISYAVGCIFGRYSVDVEGLVYAGGNFEDYFKDNKIKVDDEWVESTVEVSKDNILVITDEQYFPKDIVTMFIDFIEKVYGEDTLEKNLEFITSAIYPNKNESSRDLLREYFVKSFFKDHVSGQRYKKRPIYWLFTSGRNNAFQALIYLHRYNRDTIGLMRTEYIHKLQSIYDYEMKELEAKLESDNVVGLSQLQRKKEKLQNSILELRTYEELVHNYADQRIDIDLDDGVVENHKLFGDLLATI